MLFLYGCYSSSKDCVEDLLVSFTDADQGIIDAASCVKAKSATIQKVSIDIEPVAFQKGFYAVDLTYFVNVTIDAILAPPHVSPVCVTGLACFTKKVILFGSEGSVKVFKSDAPALCPPQTNMPRATVDVFVTIFTYFMPICFSHHNKNKRSTDFFRCFYII